MRNERLFQTLFGEEKVVVDDGQPDGRTRGRSPDLLDARDEHMLYRYVWYGSDRRNRMEWIYEQLSKEFYLSVSTICQRIELCADILIRIREEQPTEKDLKAKFPWFTWPSRI